jgi:transcription initiation factor TFIID subunit TAF12
LISSGAAEEADEERDDEEGEEQEEQDLRNTGRSTCNAPETENSRDQSNHKKDQGIVKHGCLQEVVIFNFQINAGLKSEVPDTIKKAGRIGLFIFTLQ